MVAIVSAAVNDKSGCNGIGGGGRHLAQHPLNAEHSLVSPTLPNVFSPSFTVVLFY
jgi:hypothetical protein